MKHRIEIAILVVAALFGVSCSQNMKITGVSEKTNGLCYTGGFVDANNGYAGGDNGWVMYTHDGGKTWTVRSEGRSFGV